MMLKDLKTLGMLLFGELINKDRGSNMSNDVDDIKKYLDTIGSGHIKVQNGAILTESVLEAEGDVRYDDGFNTPPRIDWCWTKS